MNYTDCKCETCKDRHCFRQVIKARSTVIWCSAYKEMK